MPLARQRRALDTGGSVCASLELSAPPRAAALHALNRARLLRAAELVL